MDQDDRSKESPEATFVATKENVDIDNAIEEKKAEKARLKIEGEKAGVAADTLENEKKHHIEILQSDIYNSGDFVRRMFPESQQGLMRGAGKEQKFFERLQLVKAPEDGQERAKYSLNAIEELHEKVYPKDPSKVPKEYPSLYLPKNLYGYRNLQGAELMETPIRSTSESPLGKLIDNLNNADWVSVGFRHYAFSDKNEECKCPFCQQKRPGPGLFYQYALTI